MGWIRDDRAEACYKFLNYGRQSKPIVLNTSHVEFDVPKLLSSVPDLAGLAHLGQQSILKYNLLRSILFFLFRHHDASFTRKKFTDYSIGRFRWTYWQITSNAILKQSRRQRRRHLDGKWPDCLSLYCTKRGIFSTFFNKQTYGFCHALGPLPQFAPLYKSSLAKYRRTHGQEN